MVGDWRTNAPGPDFTKPPVPAPIAEMMVSAAVPKWLTMRSTPAPPELIVPPVKMVAATVAVGVIKIPPEVMTSVPETVTVPGVAELKRTEYVVELVIVPVTASVLFPAAQGATKVARPVMFPPPTAHVAPEACVAQPPRIPLVFVLLVLMVPVPEKSTAPPAVRVIAFSVNAIVPPAPMVETTAPTPLTVVPVNAWVFVPAAKPVAVSPPPLRTRAVFGKRFTPPAPLTAVKVSLMLPPAMFVAPP